jgi:hypothetical protein
MSADVSARVRIYNLAPGDIELTYNADHGGIDLDIAGAGVSALFGDDRFTTDFAEEAAALRKLAELATEAADELERRAVTS